MRFKVGACFRLKLATNLQKPKSICNFKNNMTELEAMKGPQPEIWKVTKTKKSTKIMRNIKVCAANNVNASKAMKGP